MKQVLGDETYGSRPQLMLGVVKNNADPMQMGRLQIFVPAIDGDGWKLENLPWAMYVSPFGGVTANFQVGRGKQTFPNISTYGMWMIPKNGAVVLCGCLGGNPDVRFWIGCMWQPDLNRTLPFTVDELMSDLDDSGIYPQQQVPYLLTNMNEAGLGPSSPLWKTRGYERSVAYPQNRADGKPTTNGYFTKPLESDKADSQTYAITTPGRHFFVMSDVDEHCRIRLRTTEGQQVIFDDSNERIYISTAKGRNWIEIDEDGRIHIYAKDEINVRSEDDINITSEKNVNIKAKQKVNIKSETESVNVQAQTDINLKASSGSLKTEAGQNISLKADAGTLSASAQKTINISSSQADIRLTSLTSTHLLAIKGNIHLTTGGVLHKIRLAEQVNVVPVGTNPVPAQPATPATTVVDLNPKMVEPEHEPWDRPGSKISRNPKWKP